MKKRELFKPFYISVLVLMISVFFLKSIETYLYLQYSESVALNVIVQAYSVSFAVFCFYAFCVLLLYLGIAFFQKKIASLVQKVLFALLFIFECALIVYNQKTGALLAGNELLQRPFSEIWTTIQASSDLIFNVLLVFAIIAIFAIMPVFLRKKQALTQKKVIVSFCAILLVCLIIVTFARNETSVYEKNKSMYFFTSLFHNDATDFVFDENGIIKDNTLLQNYMTLYNSSSSAQSNYPMERTTKEYPDVLGAYFNKSESQPDIVVVIVESLGRNVMGESGEKAVFMPFLDSLKHHSLYWKNCVSSSVRTFGVLPAVVASAPVGIRGFQYGVMPKHYSLFSVVNENNYNTNFFYGANTNFDSMHDFISAQNITYSDNYDNAVLKDLKEQGWVNKWGLYDHILFEKSIEILNTHTERKSQANVYLTLTSHDPFTNGDIMKAQYEQRTSEIFSQLSQQEQQYFGIMHEKNALAPYLYVDDCLREFIRNYCTQINNNTIFVITGDHAKYSQEAQLPHYSVPLIIWSPLLHTAQQFSNIVSHFDITPSIISFLQHNYAIRTPEKLAWNGIELDTTQTFNPQAKTLLLDFNRSMDMIYNQYFYRNAQEELFEIDENLYLRKINDTLLLQEIKEQYKLLKYINYYVYTNNKLVNNTEISNYETVCEYANANAIECVTPREKPSTGGFGKYILMPEKKIKGKYNKLKVHITADVNMNETPKTAILKDGALVELNVVSLYIKCVGNTFTYLSDEHITKYLIANEIVPQKTYRVEIEKEIEMNEDDEFSLTIGALTPLYDWHWDSVPTKTTISNIEVQVKSK